MRPLLVILLDAFGNLISSTGTTPNNYLFAGEQFDPALGFYYMRARYYRPATGRFWMTDPIEGKLCCRLSWNPYIYMLKNPVNAADPSGEDAIIDYAIQLGEEERTVEELRVVGLAVRDELLNECVDVNMAEFEAKGVPTVAAYDLAKALCYSLID